MKTDAFGTSYGREFLELAGFLRSDAGFLQFDCNSMYTRKSSEEGLEQEFRPRQRSTGMRACACTSPF
jgi:hypothetical protein